jgi:hypothetical protein
MNKKQELGQFFTTNARYILNSLYSILPYDKEITVVDPFAGEEDLLKYVRKNRRNAITTAYDIDPKTETSIQRNSLLEPLDLDGQWVITNPPYLAKNKTKDKEPFLKYEVDDLYKCALKMISGFCGNSPCEGGVIIIPLNFFSDRDDALRKWFLSKYRVSSLRIFQERVFEDTDYTVCAFSFFKCANSMQRIKAIRFFPEKEGEKKENGFRLHDAEGYRIGAPFFKRIRRHKDKKTRVKTERLVNGKPKTEGYSISRLCLRAIDTGTKDGRICLSINPNPLYGKESDRTFATLLTSTPLTWEEEEAIVREFNSMLEMFREEYNSLILTNYRNSTSQYARKRIEFRTAFDMVECIMYEMGIRHKK